MATAEAILYSELSHQQHQQKAAGIAACDRKAGRPLSRAVAAEAMTTVEAMGKAMAMAADAGATAA